ncbi:HipA-like C-terminal domain-containing protein [Bradyrhizobium sp. Ghvi]|nr:HipA-like C-terminal domain-containing protein [Bradyrhizobium sp. Ghvi]
MHLKNWSTIYPGDGCTPAIARVYDVLSTTAYFPKDDMALSLGGEKSFKASYSGSLAEVCEAGAATGSRRHLGRQASRFIGERSLVAAS